MANRIVRDRMRRRGPKQTRRRGSGGTGLLAVAPAPFLVLALVLGLLVVGAGSAYAYFVQDLPRAEDFARDPLPLSTRVYARDGATLIYEFAEERREPARLDEVPKVLVDATVSIEDKTFWTNPGVDLGGIARAVYVNLFQRSAGSNPQGGSTIAQQLVKQRLVGGELSLQRKIREAILAIQVTRLYSKKEILELYFNQIFYGSNAYGVKAASRVYFGTTDLSKLTLAQAALLAALPQAPSTYDPAVPENLPRAEARRNAVLDLMVENGYLTQSEADAAKAEPIKITGSPAVNIIAPHFVFKVREELVRILGSEAQVSRGGYIVVTSLDMEKQLQAEKQVREWVEDLRDRNVWNAALVSMDPRTGEVLAYVGSVDYYNTEDPKIQGKFDAAGIGARQAGSAFKVFNYVTALKNGATPATVIVDARTDFGNRDTGSFRNCAYCPENADLQYHGPLTMRQALRESRNVPAVKFLQQYSGIDATVRTAREMGITADFETAQAGLSLTLGSVPVKLVDMTSAFGVLANMGVRVEPNYVNKIHAPRGELIYHFEKKERRVLTTEIAWLMNDILKETTQPSRSYVFGSWTNIGRPAALKTGTTDNLKDVYSVGYVPQLVTGVWMGNSDGTPMASRDFFSAMGPGQLWREYMKAALAGLPVQDWPRPAGIVQANVAVAPGAFGGYGSGLLPGALSPWSTTEFFVRGTVPTRADDWFQQGCPDASGQRSIVLVLKEEGPEAWKRYRDQWVKEAMLGRHDAQGRFAWSKLLSTGEPCPSPSPTPAGPTITPRPGFTPRQTTAPTPTPTRTPRRGG